MRLIRDMNPTVRGLLIVAAVSAVIAALSLGWVLRWIFLVLGILFLVALAAFVYRLWRGNRQEISLWSARARIAFYGGAAVVGGSLAVLFFVSTTGLVSALLLVALGVAGYAMWRVWRDEHTYG